MVPSQLYEDIPTKGYFFKVKLLFPDHDHYGESTAISKVGSVELFNEAIFMDICNMGHELKIGMAVDFFCIGPKGKGGDFINRGKLVYCLRVGFSGYDKDLPSFHESKAIIERILQAIVGFRDVGGFRVRKDWIATLFPFWR